MFISNWDIFMLLNIFIKLFLESRISIFIYIGKVKLLVVFLGFWFFYDIFNDFVIV